MAMEFREWEPVYRAILTDFGYDRAADERARDRLAALLSDAATVDLEDVSFEEQTVAIAGAGPNLEDELAEARRADAVVAASSAAVVLADAGVAIDLVVTDLDGAPDRVRALAGRGTRLAVHAHGDNVAGLNAYVPQFGDDVVVPTTQAAPSAPVLNTGGFTDGDRAAFLADHCGAAALTFPGWDFADPTLDREKARKLAWAERLLYWLERRRGERFALLDGRREDVDTTGLPVD
jgi:uncharacterized Rossmann fold enzyme